MGIGTAAAFAVERIVEPVEGMHHAIAGRWFAALGPMGRPVEVPSTAVSRLVYRSVRLGAVAVGAGLDMAMTVEPRTADSVRAVVNGLWGDSLGRHEDRLATPMSLRDQHGAPVSTGSELAAAFPEATGRLVVLVHGLARTERSWYGTDARPGLARALDTDPALTPVAVRYNTGLRVAANGARLASLLEELHAAWPVPIESIALIGHSMGGLVIRSACTTGRQAGHRWIGELTDVVTIGSPHRGSPLEKLATAAAWGLAVASSTRPLAEFLNRRSQGIKNLRFGAIADTDRARPLHRDHPAEDTAPAPSVRYHLIGGVITSDPTHPVGAVVGDLMVRPASSLSAPQVEPINVAVVGGVRHAALLHEPAVIDRVMAWLSPTTERRVWLDPAGVVSYPQLLSAATHSLPVYAPDDSRVGTGSTAPEEHEAPRSQRRVAMNIYVGNLPFDATDAELRNLFADYGTITSASVISDRETGRSRGFGFVELADETLAGKAIGRLDGHEWNGRRLTVNQAKPRSTR